MLFHHLVVDSEQQKSGDPLADEESQVILSVGLGDHGAHNRGAGCAQIEARWHLCRVALEHGGYLILFDITCTYAIIRHSVSFGAAAFRAVTAALSHKDAAS